MSLKIKENAKPGDLSDKEYKILQDQGNLPRGWPIRPELSGPPGSIPLDERANTGTVNTSNISLEELEAELERRRAEVTTPKISDKGGIVEEDDDDDEEEEEEEDEDAEDYTGADWTNDQLRKELNERGLALDGKKDDLIARLLRSDAETLEDGDTAASD